MRRTLPFVALWFVAGAAAAGIATAGVAVVNDQLTGSRPGPLSAADVRREVAASSEARTTAEAGSTTTTTPTTVSAGSARQRREAAEAAAQQGRPAEAGDGAPAPTVTTTTAAPAPVTRTYDLVGGTATLRFSVRGVTVLAATPAPGFAVDIGDSHDGGKRVEFESDDHRSRLEAWWDAGPRDEVREEG